MSNRTTIFEQNYHRLLLGTFHSLNFVCISFLILHASVQSLNESWMVAMELSIFSIEIIEAIAHKKVVLKMLEELEENTHTEARA